MIILTQEERIKLSSWLKQEIELGKITLKQMDNLSSSSKIYRLKIIAKIIVEQEVEQDSFRDYKLQERET
jgi:hypothetical protein